MKDSSLSSLGANSNVFQPGKDLVLVSRRRKYVSDTQATKIKLCLTKDGLGGTKAVVASRLPLLNVYQIFPTKERATSKGQRGKTGEKREEKCGYRFFIQKCPADPFSRFFHHSVMVL